MYIIPSCKDTHRAPVLCSQVNSSMALLLVEILLN